MMFRYRMASPLRQVATMNLPLLIPLLITTVVAIVGWFAAHRLSAARDRVNKRREIRLNLLMGAYRALEYSANRDFVGEAAKAVCSAFADIQLVGTPQQIKLAQKLIYEFARNQEVDWQSLLLSLRDDLRNELGLPKVPATLTHLRYVQHNSSNANE
jgi:hypothetical protein